GLASTRLVGNWSKEEFVQSRKGRLPPSPRLRRTASRTRPAILFFLPQSQAASGKKIRETGRRSSGVGGVQKGKTEIWIQNSEAEYGIRGSCRQLTLTLPLTPLIADC